MKNKTIFWLYSPNTTNKKKPLVLIERARTDKLELLVAKPIFFLKKLIPLIQWFYRSSFISKQCAINLGHIMFAANKCKTVLQ